MASKENQQRRHERRRKIDDVLSAHRIACQAGNETLARLLEAALVAGLEPIPNERRDPVGRSRLIAVAMSYHEDSFKALPAE
jgi:hypothetical protein